MCTCISFINDALFAMPPAHPPFSIFQLLLDLPSHTLCLFLSSHLHHPSFILTPSFFLPTSFVIPNPFILSTSSFLPPSFFLPPLFFSLLSYFSTLTPPFPPFAYFCPFYRLISYLLTRAALRDGRQGDPACLLSGCINHPLCLLPSSLPPLPFILPPLPLILPSSLLFHPLSFTLNPPSFSTMPIEFLLLFFDSIVMIS